MQTFTFKDILPVQVGHWYVAWGLSFLLAFVGTIVLSNLFSSTVPIYIALTAYFLFAVASTFLGRKQQPASIQISVSPTKIEISGGAIHYTGTIDKLQAIRTLHPSNPKADVQAEIFLQDHKKISLTSALNSENKQQMDKLCRYYQEQLGFTEKPVPFSIWTHNLQGIKYVEYSRNS